MYSLCFKCANARADKCKKIAFGTPIKGWIAEETKDGGYIVKECPRFKSDKHRKGIRVSMGELAQLCGCGERNLYRFADEYLKFLVNKAGYKLKIVRNENNRRAFYLKDE